METSYLIKLELPAVLDRLAEYASFSAGRQRVLALAPVGELEEVRRRQQETDQARKLLDLKSDLTLGGVHDLMPLVENALRGARLLPPDLLDVRDTLRQSQLLRRSLLGFEARFPLLAQIGRRLASCPQLIEEIDRCISERGDVLDRASAELGRIRSELGVAHSRLMDRLNRILSNTQYASFLQEAYITQRDGRYVIPVKTDARGRVPGLVHDQSASGATSFVEPLAVVDLNNEYRELQMAEQREIDRILLALSGLVADAAGEIGQTVDALAELDMVLAQAKYADVTRSTMPEMVAFSPPHKQDEIGHPGSTIDLRQARHPLLDPRQVVPIDIHLGEDYFMLLITGPNTGGKTVSLKTVGLMALMAQCGLHLPVGEGSRLSVFEHICADIGDEQSIEQSLSTFSSHMSHIIHILDTADDRSLVLLDELGAGTDPVEGAALAQSLLTHLRQRRITTIATTHYAELKMYAVETPGVVNASVEFDVETLSPTYHLSIGLPGQSNAFAIAERLGLPTPIVRRARSLVSSSHLDAERFLAQIKESQSQTALAQADIERTRAESLQATNELRARLAGIDREREVILRQAHEVAAQELEAVRKELRAVQRRLAAMSAARGDLSDLESRLAAIDVQVESVAPIDLPSLPQDDGAGTVEVGDAVWVADLNTMGQVLALEGDTAEVQVGAFRVRTRLSSLELRHKAAHQPAPSEERISMPPAPAPSIELSLRGQRVEDALANLEKYLDEAYRAQMPFVRIVHGKGTGTLRKAVHEYLRGHPLVSSFRIGGEGEGDTGVTIVKFNYS